MAGEQRSYAKLSIGTDTTEPLDPPATDTFTEVINVLNISGPNAQKGDIEVTHLQSTAKEYISDLADPGELTFTISTVWDDTEHLALQDDSFTVGRRRNYKLEWQDPAGATTTRTADFVAECMEFSPDESPGAQHQANVRLKISGTPTFT